jgi:hypothetical protein
VFDASKIDLVSLTADGGTVELHIVADAPWTGSDDELMSLQQKINTYVGFALDGQLHASYPETKGLGWRIVIDAHAGQPNDRTAQVIAQVAEGVRRYGGDLVVSSTTP